jgi:hypothetical protein
VTATANHARHCKKSKLKQRYWNSLEQELSKSLERALIIGELICEKRAADTRAKIDAMPKPCHLPAKPEPKFNDWGLDLSIARHRARQQQRQDA